MPTQADFDPSSPNFGELIAQMGRGFYVPLYQRGYTWGSEHIDRLFEDIHTGIEHLIQGNGPTTFLGSMIFFEDRTVVSPSNANCIPTAVWHVVDGQQRITTLLLLSGQVLRRVRYLRAKLEAEDELELETADRVWLLEVLEVSEANLKGVLHIEDGIGGEVHKLKPKMIRQSDDIWGNKPIDAKYESSIASYLFALACEIRPDLESGQITDTEHGANDALEFIDANLEVLESGGFENSDALSSLEFLDDASRCEALLGRQDKPPSGSAGYSGHHADAIRVVVLANFILRHIRVIAVIASSEEFAFNLFEPLNTTGMPLTPLETLKPMAVKSEGGNVSYPASQSAISLETVNAFIQEALDNDNERRKRIDALITTFGLLETGEKIPRSMPDQRSFLRGPYRSTEKTLEEQRDFLRGLERVSSFLREVWSAPHPPGELFSKPDDRVRLLVLTNSNHTICLPLLIRYYERALEEDNEVAREGFREVLRATTAFWTLWRTALTTTSGIDSVHRKLIKDGHKPTGLPSLMRGPLGGGQPPEPGAIRATLRSLIEAKLDIRSKDDWVDKVANQPLYRTTKVLARFLLLVAHRDAIAGETNGLMRSGVPGCNPTLTPEIWENQQTVEHIAPQTRPNNTNDYDVEIYNDGLGDRLGNLLLLPPGLNSAIGNRSWQVKRAMYRALSDTDPEKRVRRIEDELGDSIGAKTRQAIEDSDFMPFCGFVGEYESNTLNASFVRERSRNLASLAWDGLWAQL